MTFIPQGYNVPQAPSGYMKLKEGANKFRILSPELVTGWIYWNIENKPVRSREPIDLVPADIRLDDNGLPTDIKHFWLFGVWNYDEQMIQILEITQTSIQKQLEEKIMNRNGNANNNDFIITKTGQKLNTKYSVDVLDSSPLDPQIAAEYMSKPVNLEAVFTGDDPFKATPEAQNGTTGYEKAKAIANSLPNTQMGVAGQNSPVEPTLDEEQARLGGMAEKLKTDYEAIDHENPPFN